MVTARKTEAAVMNGEDMTDGGEGNTATDKVKGITMPKDVVYEIFTWLPAKSILKFKSCSKFIYEFTQEKYFLVKHSQNVTLQGDSSFFIIQRVHITPGDYEEKNIISLPGNKASSLGIPKNFLGLLSQRPIRILSSNHGLLLCEVLQKGEFYYPQKPKGELIICNPTAQSFSSIGLPHSFEENYRKTYVTLAFGSVHDDEVYQLLVFEYHQERESEYIVCKAYKPKEGVWKEREKGLLMGYRWALLCSYSSRGRCQNMLLYNFESGEMRRLLLPKEATTTRWFDPKKLHYHSVRLFKRDKAVGTSSDDICLVIWDKDDLVFTFWVLTDYESSLLVKVFDGEYGRNGIAE
ncbi:hypothetical protein QN277_001937 [Acacia crassicarpa]|uniref:F-box domain-containing protein n=1 Tax=Acacia crassicarpa TaxID=499986 RepID=A0AAE1N8F7_9FABA|nr:hypothetical protein QN277_001937 [Acacia crassicarpa]